MLDTMARGRSDKDEAVRITTARPQRSEEIDGRVRGYLISMSIRVVCFGAAVAVGPGPLRWVLIAGAVLLPYVAVIMANATDQRSADHDLERVITQPQLTGSAAPPPLRPGEGRSPGAGAEEETP